MPLYIDTCTFAKSQFLMNCPMYIITQLLTIAHGLGGLGWMSRGPVVRMTLMLALTIRQLYRLLNMYICSSSSKQVLQQSDIL